MPTVDRARLPLLFVVPALLVVLLTPALAREARIERKPTVDRDDGFSINLVQKMSEIPRQPGERFIKKKFMGPEWVQDWTSYKVTLEVVFVPRPDPEEEGESDEETTDPEPGTTAPPEEGEPGTIEIDIQELLGREITGAWSWAENHYREITKDGDEKQLKVTLQEPIPGKRRTKKKKIPATYFTFDILGYSGPGWRGLALVVPVEEGEWGFFYSHAAGKFGDFHKAFMQSCASVVLFPPQREEEVDREALFDEFDPEAFRAARKADLAEGWKAVDTPHYLVLHHVDDKFASNIAKRLEACRSLYERMFPPRTNLTAVSVVRVCKNRDEYWEYGGPGGSAGYWSRWDKELVFFEDKSGGKRDTFAVLQHEAFHQYIYYYYEQMAPHIWYNEGHADYFSGHAFNKRSHKLEDIKTFLWRKDRAREGLANGELVPLKEFIRYTQGQYYSNADICYAQGWAFIYFLRQSKRLRPEWRDLLSRYLENIWDETKRRAEEKAREEEEKEKEEEGEGEPGIPKDLEDAFRSQFDEDEEILEAAVTVTFEDIDLDELERAFHKYVGDNYRDK